MAVEEPVSTREQRKRVVAFVGLGAMGFPMAGHMSRLPGVECLVWNRTPATAHRHTKEHPSRFAADMQALSEAEVIVMCLPTSTEDEKLANELAPNLKAGTCIVSCTSGEPTVSKALAKTLMEKYGVHFLDCPVSGGPRGAAAASLTLMLGANDEASADKVLPMLQSFSKKVVRCGPVGAGHAVKSVNNALNVAHLLLGTEGLLALQQFGVDPEVAVNAINGSSGRSLQTELRIPEEVLTRRFGYGFKLSLMAKDCRIAANVIKDLPGASLLPATIDICQLASEEEGESADYTQVVCHLERKAGFELRAGPGLQGKEIAKK